VLVERRAVTRLVLSRGTLATAGWLSKPPQQHESQFRTVAIPGVDTSLSCVRDRVFRSLVASLIRELVASAFGMHDVDEV
jgi:hypothetical protein